jgi:hypothetical protein
MAARGVINGIGDGLFGPDLNVTRSQFLVIVMRSYDIKPDANPTTNFSDAGSTWYTNYLGTAKRLGLTSGVGNNLFLPEEPISRQDMFTLLWRMLNSLNALPTGNNGKTLADFSDQGEIADYARTAMGLFVRTGVVSGSNGRLNPRGTSSRAEATQLLYNLLAR